MKKQITGVFCVFREDSRTRRRKESHFEPNFGMVEATIAMHYVFDSPKDKIVYDVFLDRYDVQEVLTDNHLTKDQIVADITEVLA